MKAKALASYDQLMLATKRGSDDGPAPKNSSKIKTVIS